MTKVRNKPRILLASCFVDDWTNQIGTDLEKVAEECGFEFLLLAQGANRYVKDIHYINLDVFVSKFDFSGIPDPLSGSKGYLEELKKFQYLFESASQSNALIDPTAVGREVERWFQEALFILKIIQPDLVIAWNGQITKRGVYAKAVQYLRIPFFFAEKGVLPDSWCLDPKGINAGSSLLNADYKAEKGRGLEYWNDKIRQIDAAGTSAWEQPPREDAIELKKHLGIKPGQKVIFFPGQVDSDSNIVLFSPHFKGSPEVLKWLIEDLDEKEFFVLVKPHPKGALSEADFARILGNKGKSILSINVLDAIKISDCVVTINSSVAFEAAIRQKPVLMLGEGVLTGKDFIHSYVPGQQSAVSVRKLISDYQNNKDEYYKSAIAFADYLDDKYYLYRKNVLRSKQRLLKILETIPTLQTNRLSVEEIASLMAPVSIDQVKPILTKKVLASSLMEKVWKKFFGTGK